MSDWKRPDGASKRQRVDALKRAGKGEEKQSLEAKGVESERATEREKEMQTNGSYTYSSVLIPLPRGHPTCHGRGREPMRSAVITRWAGGMKFIYTNASATTANNLECGVQRGEKCAAADR